MDIFILAQDVCFPDPKVGLEEILAKEGLKSFVSSRFREDILTSSALQLFDQGELEGLKAGVHSLRESGANVELYFLTPFGLIHSQQIIVEYEECIKKISKSRLEYFLSENRVEFHLQQLLERRPSILIAYLEHRLWRGLNFIDYIPGESVTILLSDVLPNVNKEGWIFLSKRLLEEQGITRFGEFFKRLCNELLRRADEEIPLKERLEGKIRDILRGKPKKNKNLLKLIKGS